MRAKPYGFETKMYRANVKIHFGQPRRYNNERMRAPVTLDQGALQQCRDEGWNCILGNTISECVCHRNIMHIIKIS